LFPLWPGNIGLVQAAVALPLFQYYGVAKANGIAFGFGLQAIEASVGVGVGLIFLAREGLSFAMLRVMPDGGRAGGPGAAVRPLACPASLKGVLSAREAAAALAQGLREWADADELPVADGGEGTLEVLHPVLGAEWREADGD